MSFVLGRGFLDIDLDDSKARAGLGRLNSSIGGMTTGAIAGLTAIVGAITAIGVASVKAASQQEQATEKLRAALSMTSDATDENMSKFAALAADIQRVTTIGDEAILMEIAFAKSLGVTTDNLEATTIAAVGLSKRLGVDMHTAMQLLARGVQGQFQLFSRYGIVLDETMTDQEKLNKVIAFGTEGFALAEAETNTFAGSLAQVKNTVGDLLEVVGAPMLNALTSVFKAVSEFFATSPIEVYLNMAIDLALGFANALVEVGRVAGEVFSSIIEMIGGMNSKMLESDITRIYINRMSKDIGTATGRAARDRGEIIHGAEDVQAIKDAQLALRDVSVKTRQDLVDFTARKGGGVNIQGGVATGGGGTFVPPTNVDRRTDEERSLAAMIAELEKKSPQANAFIGLDQAFKQFSMTTDRTAEDQLEVMREQLKVMEEQRDLAKLVEQSKGGGGPVIEVE